MNNIIVHRDLANIVPMTMLPLIKPLCVPMNIDESFSDEIQGRGIQRIYSLWERLGLFYLEDVGAVSQQTKSDIIVNNFSQQIIFQLFSSKNTRRLIKTYQPGFVLLKNAYNNAVSAKAFNDRRRAVNLARGAEVKSLYSRELDIVLKLLSGNSKESETHKISAETLNLTLAEVLHRISEKNQINQKHTAIIERLISEYDRSKEEHSKVITTELLALTTEKHKHPKIHADRAALILPEIRNTYASTVLRIAAKKAVEIMLNAKNDVDISQEFVKAVSDFTKTEVFQNYTKNGLLGNIGTSVSSFYRSSELKKLNKTDVFQTKEISVDFNNFSMSKNIVSEAEAAVSDTDSETGKKRSVGAVIPISFSLKSLFSHTNQPDEEYAAGENEEADKKQGETLSGTVISNENGVISQATVFLLENAAQNFSESSFDAARKNTERSLLSEQFSGLTVREIRDVIRYTAENLSTELQRLSGGSRVLAEKAVVEAMNAAEVLGTFGTRSLLEYNSSVSAKTFQQIDERHQKNIYDFSKIPAFAKPDFKKRQNVKSGFGLPKKAVKDMSVMLKRRVAGYFYDKYFSKHIGFSWESFLDSKSFADYRLLLESVKNDAEDLKPFDGRFSDYYTLNENSGMFYAENLLYNITDTVVNSLDKIRSAPINYYRYEDSGVYYNENNIIADNKTELRNITVTDDKSDEKSPKGTVVSSLNEYLFDSSENTYLSKNNNTLDNKTEIGNTVVTADKSDENLPKGMVVSFLNEYSSDSSESTYLSKNNTDLDKRTNVRNVTITDDKSDRKTSKGTLISSLNEYLLDSSESTYFSENNTDLDKRTDVRNVTVTADKSDEKSPKGTIVSSLNEYSSNSNKNTYFSKSNTALDNKTEVRNITVTDDKSDENSPKGTLVSSLNEYSSDSSENTYFSESNTALDNKTEVGNITVTDDKLDEKFSKGTVVSSLNEYSSDSSENTYFNENNTTSDNKTEVGNVTVTADKSDEKFPKGTVVSSLNEYLFDSSENTYFNENNTDLDKRIDVRNVTVTADKSDENSPKGTIVSSLNEYSSDSSENVYYNEKNINLDKKIDVQNITIAADKSDRKTSEVTLISSSNEYLFDSSESTYLSKNNTDLDKRTDVRNVTVTADKSDEKFPKGTVVSSLNEYLFDSSENTYFNENNTNLDKRTDVRNVTVTADKSDENSPKGTIVSSLNEYSSDSSENTYFNKNNTDLDKRTDVRNVTVTADKSDEKSSKGTIVSSLNEYSSDSSENTYFNENNTTSDNKTEVYNIRITADQSSKKSILGKIISSSDKYSPYNNKNIYYKENKTVSDRKTDVINKRLKSVQSAGVDKGTVLPVHNAEYDFSKYYSHKENVNQSETSENESYTDKLYGTIISANQQMNVSFQNGLSSTSFDKRFFRSDTAQHLAVNTKLHENVETSYARDEEELFGKHKTKEKTTVSDSLRNRLDNRTLEALDNIIKQVHMGKSVGESNPSAIESAYAEVELVAASEQRTDSENNRFTESNFKQDMYGYDISEVLASNSAAARIFGAHLRSAALINSLSSIQNVNGHISKLIHTFTETDNKKAYSEIIHNSSIAFRTIEDSDNMVMLIPPAVMDRIQAENGYVRQLPPIEYKQTQDREQTDKGSTIYSKKPKIINAQQQTQTFKKRFTNGFDNLSREEINKLADKVYAQIETRVLRERRRLGM